MEIYSRRNKSIRRTGDGDGEKSPDSGHVLDIETTGLADRLNCRGEGGESRSRIKTNT